MDREEGRMNKIVIIAVVVLAGSVACGDDSGSMAVPINAPSELTVTPLDGGAHLTWKDNSDNEAEFMIERKTGSGDWTAVATVPFDTTQYHDAAIIPGTAYVYRVMAMPQAAADHEGAYSGEVTFTAPADGAGDSGAAGTGGAGAHGAHDAGGHG
jgi:hypothetical protein